MPVSKKQRRANRQNARKSTGPTSPEGRQIVSHNAITHGLYARDLIIDSVVCMENEQEYDLLLAALVDELQPETLFQEYLVRKIANSLWRSRRAVRAETSEINRRLDDVDQALADKAADDALIYEPEDDDSETAEFHARERANMVGARSIPPESACFNILRYEMRLDRQVTRAYALLVHLQGRRNSKSFNEDDKKQKIMIKQSHFATTQSLPTEYKEFSEPGPVPKIKEDNPAPTLDGCSPDKDMGQSHEKAGGPPAFGGWV